MPQNPILIIKVPILPHLREEEAIDTSCPLSQTWAFRRWPSEWKAQNSPSWRIMGRSSMFKGPFKGSIGVL